MKRENIISITGDVASGQTTISNMLANDLGFFLYKNGAYFRKLAAEKGMSVTEFGKYVEKHPEIDMQIEKSVIEYVKNNDNIVIDAKMGWYAVPESFKVYLKVDIDIASQRAFLDKQRKKTESFSTVEEQKKDMIKRAEQDLLRYYNLYGVYRNDMSNYDYVLDTSYLNYNEVLEKVKNEYNKWKSE